jgi:site-specific recombinase XerD
MNVMIERESILFGQVIPTFYEWLDAKGMRDETVRGYKNDLNQFHKWMSNRANGPVFLNEIDRQHFEGFVRFLKQERECKPATINRKINAMSTFFNCMKRKKLVPENPLEDFDRVKVPTTERIHLNREEVEAIIKAIKHPVIHYFAMMMAHTGIRVKECIHLNMKDVNLEEGYVQVINGKGGKDRRVPMNRNLIQNMKEYLEHHRPESDSLYFFALKKTGTVSDQYVNQMLKEACEKANIKKHVTSHILRHSFASYLVKKDTHVAVIQRLLGHADVRTTSVYLHVQQDDLRKAVNQIDF